MAVDLGWRERMNDEHVALVALAQTRPGGMSWRSIADELIECGSAVELWESLHPPTLDLGESDTDPLAQAAADLLRWTEAGLIFTTVLDNEYPLRLRDIHEAPLFLFGQGLLLSNDQGVSVVGSRDASPGGLDAARGIATALANAQLTVISGLARGIDTAAHTAALAVGGRTVAFVATGINRTYPSENRPLHEAISDTGLVLSQFWPDAPPQRHTYLMRNALMSGYGLATIVVEAGEKSGARAQARMAVEHGRPVVLTRSVFDRNEWAKKLSTKPNVYVASGIDDVASALREIRSEPANTDRALRLLSTR